MGHDQFFTAIPSTKHITVNDDMAIKNNTSWVNICVTTVFVLNTSNYRNHYLFRDSSMYTEFARGQILYREPHPLEDAAALQNGAHLRCSASLNKMFKEHLTMRYHDWMNLDIFNGRRPEPLWPITFQGTEKNRKGEKLKIDDKLSHFGLLEWPAAGATRDKLINGNILTVVDTGTYQDFPNIFADCDQPSNGAIIYRIYALRVNEKEKEQQLVEFQGLEFHIAPEEDVYPRIEYVVCNDSRIQEYMYNTPHINGSCQRIAVVQYQSTNTEKLQKLAKHSTNVNYPTSSTMVKMLESSGKLPRIGLHFLID